MFVRPKEQEIVQSYSLTELLDLVRIKAKQKAEERLKQAQIHVEALNQLMAGAASAPTAESRPSSTPTPAASSAPRLGRPPGKAAGQSPAPTGARRGRPPRGSMSLKDYLLKVLNSRPMEIREIMERLEALGYKSNAQDPRRLLYLELNKLVAQRYAVRTGRGIYKAR